MKNTTNFSDVAFEEILGFCEEVCGELTIDQMNNGFREVTDTDGYDEMQILTELSNGKYLIVL